MKILGKKNARKCNIYNIELPIMKRLHIDIHRHIQSNDKEQYYDLSLGHAYS